MVKFAGFCSYPHGGAATAGLFFTVAAALSATVYGIASCRLVVLTFSSDESGGSCFEDYFQKNYDITTTGWNTGTTSATDSTNTTQSSCRVGLGLFQWLRPNDMSSSSSSNNWQDGYCVGYQQSMLNIMGNGDHLFDVARGLGIFSVILSFVLLGWSFVMSCLELNWMQLFLLRLCCFSASLTSGLSFLIKKAELCTTMFDAVECKLDQGGLAMITACILWLIALVTTIVFMKSSSSCPFWTSREDRKLFDKAAAATTPATPNTTGLQNGESYSFDSTESWTKPVAKSSRGDNNVTLDIAASNDELELYIGSRLDKIVALAVDDNEDEEAARAVSRRRRNSRSSRADLAQVHRT